MQKTRMCTYIVDDLPRAVKFVAAFGILFLWSTFAHGQSCTSSSCQATDCTQSSVLASLPSSSNTNSAVTVTWPSCPSGVGWSGTSYYTLPSAVKSMTIHGQTSCTGSGNPAQNNLSCTDGTTILDNLSDSSKAALNFTVGSGQFIRLTGVTILAGSRTIADHGTFVFSCAAEPNQLRIDHSHISGVATALTTIDCFGAIDHTKFEETANNHNWLHVWDPYYNKGASSGNGDGSWAAPTAFGTSSFLYLEDNLISNGVDDCTFGGRVVARFNTFINGGNLQTHPTGGGGADERGCRAYEIYGNSFTASNSNPAYNAFFMSSGTALFWGNTSTAGYEHTISIQSMRRSNSTYSENMTPYGWGYCGSSFNGTSSPWDQNSNATTGYACIDQPGRGKGDLITGMMPNAINSSTGTISWVHEASEPIYEWGDKWTLAPGYGGLFLTNASVDTLSQNRDYYLWCNSSSQTACTSNFDGSQGTGSGMLAARPTTCTTGVVYWATDLGNWNQSGSGGQGQLFKCTATNTWTSFYTPYTYPSPIQSSNGTTTSTPPPPIGLSGQAVPM